MDNIKRKSKTTLSIVKPYKVKLKVIMVRKSKFRSSSRVEVKIERGNGFYGSWFTGTVVRWVSSDKLLIRSKNLNVNPTVVSLHHLRPVPPGERLGVEDWRQGGGVPQTAVVGGPHQRSFRE